MAAFRTREEMRAAHPEGPPAYYLVGDRGENLDREPLVFCCDECRGDWVTAHKVPGSRQRRHWRFVKGKPVCDNCGQALYERKVP